MRPTVGVALCGSFCTFRKAIDALRALTAQYTVVPIFSDAAWETDTRFGASADFRAEVTALCGMEPLHTLAQVEPLGPKRLLDLLIVAPCTGNTLGKLQTASPTRPSALPARRTCATAAPCCWPFPRTTVCPAAPRIWVRCWPAVIFTSSPSGRTARPASPPVLWHIFPCCRRRPRQRCGGSSSSRCSSEGLQKQAAADIIGTRSK